MRDKLQTLVKAHKSRVEEDFKRFFSMKANSVSVYLEYLAGTGIEHVKIPLDQDIEYGGTILYLNKDPLLVASLYEHFEKLGLTVRGDSDYIEFDWS